MPDSRTAILCALLAVASFAPGEEPRDAPPAAGGVPILFLPPPMEGEGTISLGIFNKAGKLVRVLHREAGLKDFKILENGLLTHWDGKDDAGQRMPPGKYSASGWIVGDLGIEGVAYHCNDWIKEESPRYARVTKLENFGRDEVRVTLRTVAGREQVLTWDLSVAGTEPPKIEIEAAVEDGRLVIRKGDERLPVTLAEGEKARAAVVGNGSHVWTIVEAPEGREVRAYSAEGDFLRRLACPKNEPQPEQLAASRWSETIFLLEGNATEQRLRALALGTGDQPPPKSGDAPAPAKAVSTWKVSYLKRVVFSDTFDAIAGYLGRAKPPKAEAVVEIQTVENPLLGDQKAVGFVKVLPGPGGAILQTKEGLPLLQLTIAPNLKWVVLAREGGGLRLFQGDGGVVEEFKLKHPDKMMSFAAGEYELKRPGEKPATPAEKPGVAPNRSKPLRPGDDL